jgi:DNA-nicking Smr family endonuclease
MKSFADLARLRDALKEEALRDEQERRRLAAEQVRREREASVFRDALAGTVPLAPDGRVVHARADLEPLARQRERDERAALIESLSDDIDVDALLDVDEDLSFRRPGVGPDVVRRLRRGEWVIREQIDLHGLRVDQARVALVEFLQQAMRREVRCVRVIHGKGLGSVNKEPVLKGKVRKWLAQREEVQAFCQARPNDGGGGALVVLLRGAAG